MPLFDRNKTTPDISPEFIDSANAVIECLQHRRVAEIVLPEPGSELRVASLVRCYLQAHVRRCLTFIEAGAVEIDADRPLAAELCTRAIYENAATVCDFTDRLKALCETNDYAGVEALVTKAAFATRIPSSKLGEEAEALQILNQIDKMNGRYPGFRTDYDHQSDIVRPNSLGVVVYFGAFTTAGVMRFDDGGTSQSRERARSSLIVAVLMLLHVELALTEAEEMLRNLTAYMVEKRG